MSKRLELAERLKRFRPGPDDHYLDQAADLLREDDTRIAELEAALRGLLDAGHDHFDCIPFAGNCPVCAAELEAQAVLDKRLLEDRSWTGIRPVERGK